MFEFKTLKWSVQVAPSAPDNEYDFGDFGPYKELQAATIATINGLAVGIGLCGTFSRPATVSTPRACSCRRWRP